MAQVAAGKADDLAARGQQVADGQVVERWQELAARQVAAGANDHDILRRWRFQAHSDLTAWPPNSLRSAAITFMANESSCREAKRANRLAAVAGAGASSFIASNTLPRPPPATP